MDEKWLKTAYQFEGEPSGGGEPAPTPPEPSPPEPGGGEPPEPSPGGPPEPTPAGPVTKPAAFDQLFAPPEPGPPAPGPVQHWQPPGAPQPPPGPQEPPAPPAKVEFPSEDDWISDPAKAGRQQAEAIKYSNYMANQPLVERLDKLEHSFDRGRRETFEQTVQRVESSIGAASQTVDAFYAEKGPLNADEEFRNNPELQESVQAVITEVVGHAIRKAEQSGDTSSLEKITSDPRFPYRVLAMAKADAQHIPENPLRPTRMPVGPQPPQPPENEGLTAEEQEALAAARADGSDITAADIIRAKKIKEKSIY